MLPLDGTDTSELRWAEGATVQYSSSVGNRSLGAKKLEFLSQVRLDVTRAAIDKLLLANLNLPCPAPIECSTESSAPGTFNAVAAEVFGLVNSLNDVSYL